MAISIDQWHRAIGLLGARRYAAIIKKKILKYSNLKVLTILLFFYNTIIFLLLVQYGDIEINPEPKKKQPKYFSCCQWNVNSLPVHDKLSLLIIPSINTMLFVYQKHSLILQYC